MFRVLNQIRPCRSTDIKHLLHSAGHFVQHLMIGSDSSLSSFRLDLSESCPNLYNLAIHLPWEWDEVKSNNLSHMLQGLQRLTRLTVWSPCLSYADILIRPCFFPNLTHLQLLLPTRGQDYYSWENWDVFAQFPKLTHITMAATFQSREDVLKLLHDRSSFPLLELLVVIPWIPMYHHRQSLEVEAEALSHNNVKDKRLVMLAQMVFIDAIVDWEKGANGGVDMWRFAELVVFARESEYFAFLYMLFPLM